MDVERTLELIVDAQARHPAHLEAIDQRMDGITRLIHRACACSWTTRETDRKINALIDAQLRTDAKVDQLADAQKELAEAQKATEQTLQAFIDSLRQGGNGH